MSEEELEQVSGGAVSFLGMDCVAAAAVVGTIVAVSQALNGWAMVGIIINQKTNKLILLLKL